MSLGSIFGGGSPSVDTSAYDAAIKQARDAQSKAEKDAAQAREQQLDAQTDIIEGNKARRANAASRFSLLLFEDDANDTLGA